MAGKGKIAGGIVLLVLGIIFSGISYSISTQCSSASGQFQGFFDAQSREICTIANFALIVGIFLAIIGLVLIIIGAVSKDKKDKGQFSCRYCGRSIQQAAEFCPSCGKSIHSRSSKKECVYCKSLISDDSKFCGNCGKLFPNPEPENSSTKESESTSLSINKTIKEQKTHAVSKSKSLNKTIWIIIIAVIGTIGGGLGLYFYTLSQNGDVQQYNELSGPYSEPVPPEPYPQSIVQESIVLEAGQYVLYPFLTPPNAVNLKISGTIGVTGGIVQHIRTYVIDINECPPPSGDYFNFNSCNSFLINQYYNDGEYVDSYIPSGGSFYLIFYNDAILGETKTVQASFMLESQ